MTETLPNIHCRPGTANTNGLHFVNTNRASKSCNVSNGRPSPSGSIKPSFTVISRYVVCNALMTDVKFWHSSEFGWQCDASKMFNFSTSRKCCSGRWINVVISGRLRGTCGTVIKFTKSEFDWRDLLTWLFFKRLPCARWWISFGMREGLMRKKCGGKNWTFFVVVAFSAKNIVFACEKTQKKNVPKHSRHVSAHCNTFCRPHKKRSTW